MFRDLLPIFKGFKNQADKAARKLKEAAKNNWGAWLVNKVKDGANAVLNGIDFVIEKACDLTGITALSEYALDKATGIPSALKDLERSV